MRAFAKRARHRVAGVFKETASGAKNDRVERKRVMALAQVQPLRGGGACGFSSEGSKNRQAKGGQARRVADATQF